jgi:FdhE protein
MKDSYEIRIERTVDLAEQSANANGRILIFYARLLMFQYSVFNELKASAKTELRSLTDYFPKLLELVEKRGPEVLAEYARQNFAEPESRMEVLQNCWAGMAFDETRRFFGRALVQPYSEYLASRGAPDTLASSGTCPFCGAKPVTAVLRGEGNGGKRSLICSLCATEWQYRRIKCPNCGEEDKEKLPIFLVEDPDYIRIEACDACKTYIKCVDMTKNGKAVPAVDELAAVSLAVWAHEKGYARLETNALGM